MSMKIVGYLALAFGLFLVIPAVVAGGGLAFAFVLPILVVGLAILIFGKLYWDWKLTKDFGANSDLNPREMVNPGVDRNPKDQRRQQRRGGEK